MIIALCTVFTAHAQRSSNLVGTIKDATTRDALPGANILLVGKSMGATTDLSGKYIVRNVPAGTYSIRITYVGYRTVTATVTVPEGSDVRKDFDLSAVAIEGETVVVTAQAAGQKEAINQQLSSMPVMNVVSAARIQELPDANAAESVSRLPGVSLIRTGGEGAKVVIRGLSPQFNQVTIDGVELPSDVASTNNLTSGDRTAQESQSNQLGDRAEDLSMISSSMLGGIEVIKAITPDMDATLIGGVVNFGMRKASRGMASLIDPELGWLPNIELRAQGGFNDLKNTRSDYRFVGSLEKRFMDDALGVFFQASTEKRNLSSHNLGVGYNLSDKIHGDAGIPDLSTLELTDVNRSRERVGGTLVLDYQYESGEIGLMNFGSTSDTKAQNRGQVINTGNRWVNYTAGDTRDKLNIISNMLSLKQEIPLFHVDMKLSHSYSESRSPDDLYFNFRQQDAGLNNLGDLTKLPPQALAKLIKPNPATAYQDAISTSTTLSHERTITGSLDLQTDMQLLDWVSSKVKFGGFYQRRSRTYDYNTSSGSTWGEDAMLNAFRAAYPSLITNGSLLSMLNFIDDPYRYGTFLNGDYDLTLPISIDMMWKLLPVARRTAQVGDRGGYQPNDLGNVINDYSGTEDKSAAYAMVTFNLGDQFTILPGVRYQNLTTEYTGVRGKLVPGGLQGGDTTVTMSHGYWLPMLHVRYTPFEWLQFHFAYTNTLNYPDYSTITPRYLIGTGFISYNNYRIKPARSQNLDLVAAFHSNEVGLLTLNGFKKRIEDLIFFSKTYVTDVSMYPDLPRTSGELFEFNTYINNPIAIDVYGIETEWQTHFWYLPQPFTGLVLNINYTHIFSEASYPKSELSVSYDDDGNATSTRLDTAYTTRLLNQPNDILNLTIGYDYMGFSARVSMLYQDNIFKKPDFWMQNRVNSAKYTRWDLSVKQELPWYGMQIFFNMNNITGENELDVNQKTSFAAYEQRYGMSADLGLRIRL
jgi:TonB-dependent receptor